MSCPPIIMTIESQHYFFYKRELDPDWGYFQVRESITISFYLQISRHSCVTIWNMGLPWPAIITIFKTNFLDINHLYALQSVFLQSRIEVRPLFGHYLGFSGFFLPDDLGKTHLSPERGMGGSQGLFWERRGRILCVSYVLKAQFFHLGFKYFQFHLFRIFCYQGHIKDMLPSCHKSPVGWDCPRPGPQ